MRQIQNREHWLTIAAGLIDERITSPAGYSANPAGGPLMGSLRISVGHPSKFAFRHGSKGKAVGETFDATLSTDGTTEIFISPFLDEAMQVLSTITHEMGHASCGVKAGHNEHFVAFTKAVGLTGPATATVPGIDLAAKLNMIAIELGPYPHGKLDVTKLPQIQTTRLLKCICINDVCPFKGVYGKPYNLRITWQVASKGTPKCGVCDHRMGVIKPSGQKGGGGGGGGGKPEEPEEEPEVIVIDPQSGGGGGEGDNSDSEDGDESDDGDGEASGSEGSEGEAGSGDAEAAGDDDNGVEPETDGDGSGTDSGSEEGGDEEAGGSDGSTGQEDGNEDGSGEVSEGDADSADSGEAEGEDRGEAGAAKSRLTGPGETVEVEGEEHFVVEQASNPDPFMGGGGGGKGKVGRAKVQRQHEVTMTCQCATCVAQRKLMGL